jgi:hypothetical protein
MPPRKKRGPGRPALPASERKSKNLTFRSRTDLRKQLEQAARLSDRSISEEIELRLEQSFQNERSTLAALEFAYGAGLSGLLLAIGEAMNAAGRHAGFSTKFTLDGSNSWWNDPYAFDQAVKAAIFILEAFRPFGGTEPPRHLKGIVGELDMGLVAAHIGEGLAADLLRKIASSRTSTAAAADRVLLLRRQLGELVERIEKLGESHHDRPHPPSRQE